MSADPARQEYYRRVYTAIRKLPPMIYDTNFADVPMRLTYDSGKAVIVGDVVHTGKGDIVTVTGGRAPRKENSEGRIWVRLDTGVETEYYPSVVNAKWKAIE